MQFPQIVPVGQVNAEYLETLLGYNARRAALVIIELFLQRMAVHELRPVEFSVLSLIVHNPGVTSRQLCGALNLLPTGFTCQRSHGQMPWTKPRA